MSYDVTQESTSSKSCLSPFDLAYYCTLVLYEGIIWPLAILFDIVQYIYSISTQFIRFRKDD